MKNIAIIVLSTLLLCDMLYLKLTFPIEIRQITSEHARQSLLYYQEFLDKYPDLEQKYEEISFQHYFLVKHLNEEHKKYLYDKWLEPENRKYLTREGIFTFDLKKSGESEPIK